MIDNKSKIAIIGGSGRVGNVFVRKCLDSGLNIRLLLRNPEKSNLSNENIEIVKGDVREYNSVKELLNGCKILVSMLGHSSKSDKPFFYEAMNNILIGMKECNLERFIFITGLSINISSDKKSLNDKINTFIMRVIFPTIIKDKQKGVDLVVSTKINWTLVRLPFIEVAESKGNIKVNLEKSPGKKITTGDLADFLLKQIEDKAYIRKSPFIAN